MRILKLTKETQIAQFFLKREALRVISRRVPG